MLLIMAVKTNVVDELKYDDVIEYANSIKSENVSLCEKLSKPVASKTA